MTSLTEAEFMGEAVGFPSFFMKEGLALPGAKAPKLEIVLGGGSLVRGDMNRDGTADLTDLPLFVVAVLAGEPDAAADMNADGAVNAEDIAAFIQLLTGA